MGLYTKLFADIYTNKYKLLFTQTNVYGHFHKEIPDSSSAIRLH